MSEHKIEAWGSDDLLREITTDLDLGQVTRVTVVSDEHGREFEGWGLYEAGCVLSLQDSGRTLKVFPSSMKEASDD